MTIKLPVFACDVDVRDVRTLCLCCETSYHTLRFIVLGDKKLQHRYIRQTTDETQERSEDDPDQ